METIKGNVQCPLRKNTLIDCTNFFLGVLLSSKLFEKMINSGCFGKLGHTISSHMKWTYTCTYLFEANERDVTNQEKYNIL